MAVLTRGERFKDARNTLNQHGKQTMKAVEQATGVSASLIKDLEDDNSKRSVGYDKVAALAKHYGVSANWLLELSDDPAMQPSAVDELGLKPIVIEEIRDLAAEMGFFDGDDTSGTPLQALNAFLNRSLQTPLYEMINCLHDAVVVERSATPSKLISDDDRKYIRGIEREDIHAGYVLKNKLIDLHPDLRGRIHVIYGSQRLKPQVDEICDLFRSIVENMTGYRNFINEWD